MTQILRVTLDGHPLERDGKGLLTDLYRTRAAAVATPSGVPSLRLIYRDEPYGTTIEPFVGSASLRGVLDLKKKRSDALALLAELVTCALVACDHVGALFTDEGGALPLNRIALPFEALQRQRRFDKAVWYAIASPPTPPQSPLRSAKRS